MFSGEPLKVLLVEDDEDDYLLTKALFSEITGRRCELTWLNSYPAGLAQMWRNEHDICLVDYRLGAHTGIDLLREAQARGCNAPIILLTGQGEHQIDMEAMKAGAADYLVKGRLDAGLLERSIRYAMERKRAVNVAAADQMRLARFGAAIGLILTRRDSLDTILQRCAAIMVHTLGCDLARIWTYNPDDHLLTLHGASIPNSNGSNELSEYAVPLQSGVIGDNKPFAISPLIDESAIPDRDFPKGMTAYAGYPILLEDRLVGFISLFFRERFSRNILEELGSVVNGIALCIERKRSEKALDASEGRYRSVVETITEVVFQADEQGAWTFLSPAWTDITGYTVKETLGRPMRHFLHPEDCEHFCEVFMPLTRREQPHARLEVRLLANGGGIRWLQLFAQPLPEQTGSGAAGTMVDITQRKRAEAEIQKLAAFPRFNPEPVVEFSAQGRLNYSNDAAQTMARSLGESSPGAILPRDAVQIVSDCLRSENSRTLQTTHGTRSFAWLFVPVPESKVVHAYATETTERLSLEAQLRHSVKMEAVGQLAAGVAHDFNNILTIVQGHSNLLLDAFRDSPVKEKSLKQICLAAERAGNLIRQLLMFSRKQVMQPRHQDLNEVIKNITQMLQRFIGEDIAFEQIECPDLPNIYGDTGMIEQVLMNLAVNARDAMPRGGRFVIATSVRQFDHAATMVNPEARTGEFVCLSVADTGCGMDPITLNRIFEPFFTTKEVGKGTGLGLATVYGIVKQHQGWIEVESKVGMGTSFRIYFPSTIKAAPGPSLPTEEEKVQGGNETILVVEDEPALRELVSEILGLYGYDVLSAGSGPEALKIWNDHRDRVDLLLTDMVMPEGISGRELAERLQKEDPQLKIIYTSGYSPGMAGKDLALLEGFNFLPKPYPPTRLAEVVRDCLDVAAEKTPLG